MVRSRSRAVVLLVLGLGLAVLSPQIRGDDPVKISLESLRREADTSVASLRLAAAVWDERNGPKRQVVDQVCLVPDVATFFEAIATWDEAHWFPILIEDVDLTLKFLHSFRPARVVRYPRRVSSIPADRLWDAAVAAVGRSWVRSGAENAASAPRGDAVPAKLGPLPPGVVVSASDAPMLAGAVALAAGRFEPLVRWETPRRYGDVLSIDEARALARDLEARVAERVGSYDQIGDACDFLTLAGDWPYRYRADDGENAFDDLAGRVPSQARRWAFTGRLLGDPGASVYRAMCALFLQPDSAVLFNGYPTTSLPYSDYSMSLASVRFGRRLAVTHREGDQNAGLAGWLGVFQPMNRFGLVLINASGGAIDFSIHGTSGQTADIPPSVSTAVVMTHSFSAANPNDPETLAGRWLANGAYLYFGSMYEPFLQSFRDSSRLSALLTDGVPFGAATRQLPPELFGRPWRLVMLGDPLARLASGPAPPRLAEWSEAGSWPRYAPRADPGPGASEDIRLIWALQASIAGSTPGARITAGAIAQVLRAIERERLSAAYRPLFDALLIDALLRDDRLAELHERLTRIPLRERTVSVRHVLEWCQVSRLQALTADHDADRAQALWDEVIRSGGPEWFLSLFTSRVTSLADSPARRASWRNRLQIARRGLDGSPAAVAIDAELKRLDAR
jgi:hypothetical protein